MVEVQSGTVANAGKAPTGLDLILGASTAGIRNVPVVLWTLKKNKKCSRFVQLHENAVPKSNN